MLWITYKNDVIEEKRLINGMIKDNIPMSRYQRSNGEIKEGDRSYFGFSRQSEPE